MQSFWLVFSIVFVSGLVYASFIEWALHRYVMHRPLGKFVYPFRQHAQVHHQIFKADHTYHLINDEDKWTIPMAWWNGPVLVLIASAPFWLASWVTGIWAIGWSSVVSIGFYYSFYEYIHWCMHLPKKRRVEQSWWYFRLNGHHLLHHRYMHKNFNVVMPLADLCLGTLLLRSKVKFAQPLGPSVPNVQPLDVPEIPANTLDTADESVEVVEPAA
jgi:hypothetical protein